jgi:serine/threonine-protein kinase
VADEEATTRRAAWRRALELLDDALDLPAADRPAWLAAQHAEPAPVQAALAQLLRERSSLETGGFLAGGPALAGGGDDDATLPGWAPGQTLGPWRLLRALGRGGMATVWLAERADGAHQRPVALKLPHATGGNARVVAERFARERRILSTLRHPHIAQVLDAGAAGAQPWLAMEYIDGAPITRHAEERGLDTRSRLRLFLAVLAAVQHAHAQLVIHRDIKPANVLVDGDGQVKLLDFGVAKLLERADTGTEDTALTQIGGRAMTPQYASPEQVSGRPLATATDVYSLGVLLYELLTGQLPYVLSRASAAALEDAILAAQVRKPSSVVKGPAAVRALRGDIDTVVLKALQPEPAARYASAAAFAEDIERHLSQLPIKARPDSLAYRLKKLWARQRLPIVTGSAVTVALVSALAVALWQAGVARQAAQRAEAVQRFLATTLAANDPQVAQGRAMTARDALDHGAQRIATDFADDPATQAQLDETVGRIYIALGDPDTALPHLERAVAQYATTTLAGGERHVEAAFMLQEAFVELLRWPEAQAAIAQAQRLAREHAGEPNRWQAELRSAEGWVAFKLGRIEDAVRAHEDALALQAATGGEASQAWLKVAGSLAVIYNDAGRGDEALALHSRIVYLGSRLPGHETTDRLVDRGNLAQSLGHLGHQTAAAVVLGDLVPELLQHLGPGHDRTVQMRSSLAQALSEGGRFDEALREQRANVEAVIGAAGDDSEAATLQRAVLAKLLRQAGRTAEALPLAVAASRDFDRRYAEPTWFRERARWLAAEARIASGDTAARTDLRAAVDALAAMLRKPAHPIVVEGRLVEAVALREEDAPAAAALAGEACTQLRASAANGVRRLPRCEAIAAWLRALASTDAAAAHKAFVAARDDALAPLPTPHPLRAELLAAEAEIVRRLPGGAARAAALLREADALHRAAMGGLPLPQPMRLVH